MDLNPDFKAAEPDPTLFETGAAAFKRSTISTMLYQPLIAERLMPSDTTPVADTDIEQRLIEERLVTADQLAQGQGEKVLSGFTSISTKGQLEAQIEKFKFARDNDAILQASSTPAWLASQVFAGVLDPSIAIPGTLGMKVAGKGFAEVVAKFGAGAAVQAAVTEGEQTLFDPAHEFSAGSLLANVAGATVLGGFLGYGLSRLIPHAEQTRLGDGLKKELIAATDGTLEKQAGDLGTKLSETTRQFASGERSAPELAAAIEAKFGEKATPSQLALADSFGMEALARSTSRVLGRSVPLEMIHADSTVAREFAADNFLLRGVLEKDGDTIYSPDSIYAQKAIVDGHLANARKGVVDNWKEWAGEQAVASGVIERNLAPAWKKRLGLGADETRLSEFSDLVAKAVVLKNSPELMTTELKAAIEHPAVQRAAAEYRKFEDTSFEMLKKAGLITEDRRIDGHLRHVYNDVQIALDQGRVIQTEAYYAAKHHFNEIKTAAQKELAKQEAKAHTTFADDTQAITDILQKANLEESLPGSTKPGAVGKFQQRLRESLNDYYENYTEQVAALNKRYDKLIDDRERRLEKVSMNKPNGWFDQQVANLRADLSDKFEADRIRIHNSLYSRMKGKFSTAEKRVLDAVESKLDTDLLDARANYRAATSSNVRAESDRWGRQHAEGNFKAVAYGMTGDGSGGIGLTGGNVRGSRLARNYFTPSAVMLQNGWLDTDIMKIMDKTARQDMTDSLIAQKYRRPMTEAEQKLFDRDHPEAYWKHGEDRTTVPDLSLQSVKEALVKEYMAKGVKISDLGDRAPEFKALLDKGGLTAIEDGNIQVGKLTSTTAQRTAARDLADEARRMLDYIDQTRDTLRGTHTYSNLGPTATSAVGLAKSTAFATYLGGSLLTNLMDATRLSAYHGFGTTLQYVGARLAEKFNDKALFRDIGRAELREQAAALGYGLEQYHNVSAQGFANIADPLANSGRDASKIDKFSDAMSTLGGKAFGLEWWNNYIKTAAYGLSQYKISKLALTDPKKITAADTEYLKYIGMTPDKLTAVRKALNDQGVTEIKGAELGRIKLDKWTDTKAKEGFLASINKDVTTSVIQPNQGNVANYLQSPLLSIILQFQSYAQEAQASAGIRLGQQMASGQGGQHALAGQMMFGMATGALMTYYLKGVANGDLDKRNEAFEKTPGQVMYQLFDYTGVLPMVTNLNNMVENSTGIGLKRATAYVAGDQGKMMSGSHRSQTRTDMGSFLGPAGKIVGDLATSANSAMAGKFDDKAYNKLVSATPFSNALPLKVGARVTEAMTGQGLDAFRASRGTREAIQNSGITPLDYMLPFATNRR